MRIAELHTYTISPFLASKCVASNRDELDSGFSFLIVDNLVVGLTKDDILKNLLTVSGLVDANVQENYIETTVNLPVSSTIDISELLPLTRKSTVIFVKGGSDIDIAKSIALKINLSILRYGNVEIPVFSNLREQEETIQFYRATPTKIYYKIILEGLLDLNATRLIIQEVLEVARIGGKLTSGSVEKLIHERLDRSRMDNIEIEFSYNNLTGFTNSFQLKNDEYVGEIEEVLVI